MRVQSAGCAQDMTAGCAPARMMEVTMGARPRADATLMCWQVQLRGGNDEFHLLSKKLPYTHGV